MTKLHISLLFLVVFMSACSPLDFDPYPTLYPSQTPTATSSPSPSSLSAMPAASTVMPTCKVSTGVPAGHLNLREGTGMSYAVVRVLNDGETLTVMNTGDWLEVKDAQGDHGFINSKYCEVQNERQ